MIESDHPRLSIVKLTTEDILAAYCDLRAKSFNSFSRTPKFWDGKAARRIADVIARKSNRYQGIL